TAVPTAAPSPPPTPRRASPQPSASPRHVNSKLPHADSMAWSPDAKELALAVNAEIQVYTATGADGAAPAARYLSGGAITGIDWSGPLTSKSLALVKPNKGPQSFVDGLLDASRLPAAADTLAARPQTT